MPASSKRRRRKEKRLVVGGACGHSAYCPFSRLHEPLDVFGQDVGLQVHLAAGLERAERGHGQGIGNQRDAEAVGLAVDDRQAHAVDGHRALRGHLPAQPPRQLEPEERPLAVVLPRAERPHVVDVPSDEVPAQPVAHRQRSLQVDEAPRHKIAEIGPGERLRPGLEAERGTVDLDHRQATAVDADAVGHFGLGGDLRFADDQPTASASTAVA